MSKKIYILVYSEWDGGGGSIEENVVASFDKEKLETKKTYIEEKSKEAMAQISELEKKKYADLLPHSQEFNKLIGKLAPHKANKMDANERSKLVKRRMELTTLMGEVQKKFTEDKNEILNNLNLTYSIDDPETASLFIEELEVLE